MGEYEQTRRDASTCCCKDHPYTKMKKGPNDASGVVWALGVVFFHFFSSILLTTKAHSSQRRPLKANAGPQKPTAANAGPQKPTAANDGQRRPTQGDEGPQQLTQVHKGPQQPMTANEGQRRPTKTKRAQTTRLASFGP